ncbi:MAG: hypothetical protein RIT40_1233 [Planctomycetota bacterium]|jgi:leucyl aminopeptidase
MKLTTHDITGKTIPANLHIIYVEEGKKPELPKGLDVPAHAFAAFKGEFRETRLADCTDGSGSYVLALGVGKLEQFDHERARRVAAVAVQKAEATQIETAAVHAPRALHDHLGAFALGLASAEGALLGSYRFDKRKTKPKARKLKHIAFVAGGAEYVKGFERGRASGEACAFVRDLQNEPANCMTPKDLAAAAKTLAKGTRIKCTVLEPVQMKKLGMGLLLGVANGSDEPARFVHLVYKPKGKAKGRICVIGKGLTFDSGGISIKPSAKMDEMRYDMSGGAAVLGLFHALGKVDVPWEVHGLVAATENMPNGRATKPGDIHIAMDGTTVEVLNTDAEGRLVLADALCYAREKVKPDTMVDLATLTGAVTVALGHELAGMFASTAALESQLRAAGEETGERLWPLPLLDLHKDAMKGSFGDLKNIAGGDMGAGSSAGAAFLAHFAGNVEWAHLDIAGVAWGGSARDWTGGPMGSGYGTRLLLRWLETR